MSRYRNARITRLAEQLRTNLVGLYRHGAVVFDVQDNTASSRRPVGAASKTNTASTRGLPIACHIGSTWVTTLLSPADADVIRLLRNTVCQLKSGEITSQACGWQLRRLWPSLEWTPADWNDEFLDAVGPLIHGPETTSLTCDYVRRSLDRLEQLLGIPSDSV